VSLAKREKPLSSRRILHNIVERNDQVGMKAL
jgi:hypothetical protein